VKLKPIENQVVVVMGASSGIGRETALRFAKRGAKVVVAARSEAGLRSLEEEIRGLGGEARVVVADVCEFEQVEALHRASSRSTVGSTPGYTSRPQASSPPSTRQNPMSSGAWSRWILWVKSTGPWLHCRT
jgi:shikimate 5-dehydrogenase